MTRPMPDPAPDRGRTGELARRLQRALPARRTVLKLLHGSMIPLTGWFVIATPDFVRRTLGPRGADINSDIALLYVTLCLLWFADYLRRGLAGRPGPKLPPWGRRLHGAMHHALVWSLFAVAVGGFLLGLTSARLLLAGGFLPIAPPLDLPAANHVIGRLHVAQFYLLAALALGHGAFHTSRHLRLRDNALRIMAPKVLHRFL